MSELARIYETMPQCIVNAKVSNSKKKNYVIPRTERSAFRSRDYYKSELESMVDDIDSIKF